MEFDTALCAPVMHDGEEKILGGYLDYTLFYKHTARTTELTTLSANLVVMEAKWKNSTDTATAQIVSYMGEFSIPLFSSSYSKNYSNNLEVKT